jgi:hypothetical protein
MILFGDFVLHRKAAIRTRMLSTEMSFLAYDRFGSICLCIGTSILVRICLDICEVMTGGVPYWDISYSFISVNVEMQMESVVLL